MTNRMANSSTLVAALDGLVALAVALVSAVQWNVGRMTPGGMSHFLEMRVTLLNATFGAVFVLIWMWTFTSLGLYRLEFDDFLPILKRTTVASAFMATFLLLYLLVSRTTGPSVAIAATFFASVFGLEIFRVVGGHRLRRWAAGRNPKVVLILGSGRRAMTAWRQLRIRYYSTVRLLGFVDDRPCSEMPPDIADRYLGTVDQLGEFLLRNVVDELLIALPAQSSYEMIQRAVAIAEQVGVTVVHMRDFYGSALRQRLPHEAELFTDLVPRHPDYLAGQTIKRLLDMLGAIIGLVFLSPIFLLVAAAIKVTSKGPVVFVQQRYGARRRLFRMYKFRSMVANAAELMPGLESRNEASGPIFKMKHDPRVTTLGRFLRASSIDELPQLWNVLVGDMSLVGPRPLPIRDVSLFGEAALMRRFSVRPGITGLWQVNGRSDVSFEQWIKFDFRYIDDWSLGLDFWILTKTVGAVVKRAGAV
jgi:exopolysaccharide biosynthesis polyprenyl glycosylphosphotransferase